MEKIVVDGLVVIQMFSNKDASMGCHLLLSDGNQNHC